MAITIEYCLASLLFWGLILLACAVGAKLLHSAGISFHSQVEAAVFSFGLGFALIAYLVLLLGMFNALSLRLLIPILALLSLYAFTEIRKAFSILKGLANKAKMSWWLMAASFLFLIIFFASLSPSYSNDSMAYHLTDAKYFAKHHYVGVIPNNSTNALWPYLVEMFFTLLLLCHVPAALGLVQFVLFAASSFAIYSLCKRFFNPRIGKLSMLMFMLTPGIFIDTLQTYVDMGMVFYGMSAFYALLVWQETKGRTWLVLSGLMAGFALSTKYFSLIVVLVLLGFFIYDSFFKKDHSSKASITLGVLYVMCVFLSSFIWYARQYIILGNPVFPFFYQVFGTGGLDKEVLALLSEKTIRASFGMGAGIADFFTVSWRLTMNPRQFGGEQLGPLFLAIVPGIFFLRQLTPVLKKILGFVLAYAVIWFFVYQNLRFLLPIVPFLSILAACVVIRFTEKSGFASRMMFVLTAIFMSLQFLLLMKYSLAPLKTVLGFENNASYLSRHERSYEISQRINRTLKANAHILVVNEGHTFFLDTANTRELYYWIYTRYDKKYVEPAQVVGLFTQEGFSHILYARTPKGDNETGTQSRLTRLIMDDGFKKTYLKEILTLTPHSENSNGVTYFLYEIKHGMNR